MQQQSAVQQAPEERRFLIDQARRLQQTGQTCKIVTNSEHSVIIGRVSQTDEGGVVFEALGTGERLISPWSNVAEFVELSSAGQQGQQSQAAGASSGGSSGYYGSQRP